MTKSMLMMSWRFALWPGFVLLCVLLVPTATYQPESPTDLGWLRSECGDGALVHHAGGRLYVTELSDGISNFLANGNQPEWSPDSSRLAWIDGTSVKGRMRAGDSSIHTIARGVEPNGGVHWSGNQAVMVILKRGGRKEWTRVSLSGEEEECPELTRLGLGGYECDVRLAEDGVWSYVAKRTWRTSDGKSGTLAGTCSVSISPDGRSATSLHNPHKECTITALRPGGIDRTTWWKYQGGFDNHRWSSNDSRYIVAVDEHTRTMAVMTVDGSRCARMGTLGKAKHGMYGDFTVGPRRSTSWIEREPAVQAPDSTSSGFSSNDRSEVLFLWDTLRGSNTVSMPDGSPRLCRLFRKGRVVPTRHFGLDVSEGWLEVEPDISSSLARDFRRSNEFSIELGLATKKPLSDTKQMILSFGAEESEPDFVLARHKESFLFTLRTSNRLEPSWIELGRIGEVGPHHLVISYISGSLFATIDGTLSVEVKDVRGDLSPWNGGALQVGSERENFRGAIEKLALYSRSLKRKEALARSKLWWASSSGRPEVARWSVKATLMTKTPIPPSDAYPDALVVFSYRINTEGMGLAAGREVSVVHWGTINGELKREMGDRSQGEDYSLVLERFEEHPELEALRIAWGDVDMTAPVFYGVEEGVEEGVGEGVGEGGDD